MGLTQAHECDVCGKLFKKAFIITVENEDVKFSFKDTVNQPKLYLTVCKDCLSKVGDVINGSLHG